MRLRFMRELGPVIFLDLQMPKEALDVWLELCDMIRRLTAPSYKRADYDALKDCIERFLLKFQLRYGVRETKI